MRNLALAFLLCGAGCGDPRLREDAFSSESEDGRYALAHRDLVVRYVREAPSERERWERMSGVLSFLQGIEKVDDAGRIAALARESEMPGFWARFDQDHYWAERDANVVEDRKPDLIRAAFRRALRELELEREP